MKIDIVTLFPKMFEGPFNESIIKRAEDKKLIEINIHDLRKWTTDNYRTVDDHPYGGGAGMIIKIDIVDKAICALKEKNPHAKVILTDAGGKKYNQQTANSLSKENGLIILCGHYEGFDHRVHEHLADEIISVGDFVLTGGEIPSMAIVDSVVRLIPGVLGKEESLTFESHSKPGYLEYPQYTRPEKYKGWEVPRVLLSGDHVKIAEWRNEKSG